MLSIAVRALAEASAMVCATGVDASNAFSRQADRAKLTRRSRIGNRSPGSGGGEFRQGVPAQAPLFDRVIERREEARRSGAAPAQIAGRVGVQASDMALGRLIGRFIGNVQRIDE